jgi:hypothetical protein
MRLMQSSLPMHLSPRRGAYSRRTGKPCRNGAMSNGRCRTHGGKMPRGESHGAFLHSEYTIEAISDRRMGAGMLETANALVAGFIRARFQVLRQVRLGTLRPDEGEAQLDAIDAGIDAARVMRRQAMALKHAWVGRRRSRVNFLAWWKPSVRGADITQRKGRLNLEFETALLPAWRPANR